MFHKICSLITIQCLQEPGQCDTGRGDWFDYKYLIRPPSSPPGSGFAVIPGRSYRKLGRIDDSNVMQFQIPSDNPYRTHALAD
jgi:hypothetical protein